MTKTLKIGIAGAGTAGLAAAIALARAGHDVQVLEKHPGLSPRGAGLLIQPQGLRALEQLGVGPAFGRVSVPVHRLVGNSHRGWPVVDIDHQASPARAVGRSPLAAVLFEAARSSGAVVEFGAEVRGLRPDGSQAVVQVGDSHLTFDAFIIADGADSSLREPAGLMEASTLYKWGALWGVVTVKGWPHEDVLMQRYRGTREMMGLMPTQQTAEGLVLSFFWSLRRDQHQAWAEAPLSEWKAQVLSLWPEAAPAVAQFHRHADLAFAQYRHTWPKRLVSGPFAVIGDAAHAASPQLGLGTTLAVQDALALARGLEAGNVVDGLAAYERARKRPSQFFQTLSRALTPCFQATGPGLWRDVLFAGGRYVPGVQYLMKRSLAAPPPKR